MIVLSYKGISYLHNTWNMVEILFKESDLVRDSFIIQINNSQLFGLQLN